MKLLNIKQLNTRSIDSHCLRAVYLPNPIKLDYSAAYLAS